MAEIKYLEHFLPVHKEKPEPHRALALLSTYLLFMFSMYTLFLSPLASFVEYLGASTFVDIILIICFAYVIYRMMKKSGYSFQEFGLTLDNWRVHVKESLWMTLPILILFLVIKWVLITNVPSFSHIPLFNPVSDYKLILYLYSIYIVFSIIQEFIARAGLQSAFTLFLPKTKGRTILAILLSNLLFAAAHAHIGTLFALVTFVPGLFWGIMFAKQKSLVGVSVSHIIIGIWVLFILGFTEFIK